MLARQQRLRRDTDIKNVMRSGRCFVTPHMRVCLLPTKPGDGVRVACVCGKAVSPLAVKRHRYQRWLRSLAKKMIIELDNNLACDMVWVARLGIDKARDLHEVQQKLWENLQKIKELCR